MIYSANIRFSYTGNPGRRYIATQSALEKISEKRNKLLGQRWRFFGTPLHILNDARVHILFSDEQALLDTEKYFKRTHLTGVSVPDIGLTFDKGMASRLKDTAIILS